MDTIFNFFPMILAAMKAIAGVCDGAQSHDNVGFNGRHTGFGKEMASRSFLTPNMASACVKILKTYKNTQLPVYGFDYAELVTEFETWETRKASAPAKPVEQIFHMRGAILATTERAWQVRFSGGKVCWLPKSRVTLDCNGFFHVPAWLVRSNGLEASN